MVEPGEPEDMNPDQEKPVPDVVDAEHPPMLLVEKEDDDKNALTALKNY